MNEIIKEEVYKCSKCGLCKSVCPIYLATKNEMYSPRGRHIILNNFLQNGKKPSNSFFRNLDICLNCNLCKDFCPSDIDSGEIFRKLKKSSIIFYLKIFFKFFTRGFLNYFKKNKPQKNISDKKVLYFEGCYNKYIDCSDANTSIKLIEELGYEVEKIISACCGYIYLSNNDEKLFKKNEEKITSNCNTNAKYIICSCDTCIETLLKIDNKEFTSKLITLDEFLKQNNHNFELNKEITYFKPLTRKKECYLPDNVILTKEKGACSLMENFFTIKHPKLAKKIANDSNHKNEQTIITTCNITKWGLSKIQKKKVFSYSQYVKKEVD